jgi:hypothetical protein
MAENRTTRLAEIYKSEKSKGGGVGSTLGKAALEKMDLRQVFNQKGFLAAALPSLFKAYRATPDIKGKNLSPSTSTSTFNSVVLDEMNTNMKIVAKESLNLSRIAFDMNLMKQNTATLVRNQNKKTTGKAASKGDMFFKKAGSRDADYKSKFKKESKSTSPSSASGTGSGGSAGLKDIGMNALDSAMSGLGKGVGLAAIGLGIGGFIAGLALGGAAANALGGGSGIKDILVNLAEGLNAFNVSSLMALGAMLGAGMIFGAVGGVGNSAEAAIGMGAVGLGFGGFIAGLALGGAGVQMFGGPQGVRDLLVNLAEGLNAFEPNSLIALGSMLGAGMLFGAVGGPAAAAYGGIGIAAVGAGLGGFLAALAVAGTAVQKLGGSEGIKELLINLAAGLNPLSELNGTNLLKVGGGLLAITGGLAALFGLKIASGIKEFFFGEDDPNKGPLAKLAEQLKLFKDIDGENLSKLGQGFKDLTSGLSNLASMSDKDISQAQKNTTAAVGMAKRSGSASPSSPSPAAGNPSGGSSGGGSVPPTPSQVPSGSGIPADGNLDSLTFNQLTREQQDALLAEQRKQEGFKPGTLSYDLNNPGNILYTEKAREFGGERDTTGRGVGSHKGLFAKFPTLEAGVEAQRDLWSRKYGNMPIKQAVSKWAPDANSGYANALVAAATSGKPASQVASAPSSPSSGQKVASTSTSVADGQRAAVSGGGGNVTNTVNNVGGGGASQPVFASSATPYDDSIARMLVGQLSA